MPALRDLIPAEFFVCPPPKRLRPHGTIDLCRLAPYQGQVVVAWGKGCPIFNENLAAARKLKTAGLGTYRPDHGGWVFAPHAIQEIFEEFPTLEVSNAVLDLLAAPPVAPEPGRVLHGTISLVAGQFHVSFGNGFSISREQFADYLAAARSIRSVNPGSKGWVAATKSWAFARSAAARLILSFPADHFDHPPELVEAAKASPIPTQPPATFKQEVRDDGEPDAYATRLLAVAEGFLVTL